MHRCIMLNIHSINIRILIHKIHNNFHMISETCVVKTDPIQLVIINIIVIISVIIIVIIIVIITITIVIIIVIIITIDLLSILLKY